MEKSIDLANRLFCDLDKKLAIREIGKYNCIVLSFAAGVQSTKCLESTGLNFFCVNNFQQACSIASLANISWSHFILIVGSEFGVSAVSDYFSELDQLCPSIAFVVGSSEERRMNDISCISGRNDAFFQFPIEDVDLAICLKAAVRRRKERVPIQKG